MKPSLTRMVAVEGTNLVIKVDSLVRGVLNDPALARVAFGGFQPPQAISILGNGPHQQVTYSWWVEGGIITLATEVYQVTARHSHKSLFYVTDDSGVSAVRPIAHQVTATFTKLRPRPPRPSVWRQESSGLAASIWRTGQLHAQTRRLLTALPSDDV